MKKILYSLIFIIGFLGLSENISAQTTRDYFAVSQKSDDGIIVAYPNPAKDFIYVKSKNPNQKVKSIVFYSILGNKELEVYVNANFAEIRLDRLRSGKYLMRYIMSDDSQKVTQIIKQ